MHYNCQSQWGLWKSEWFLTGVIFIISYQEFKISYFSRSTTIGVESNWNSFDSKIDDSIDSKRQKKFEKFDNYQFEIRSIRKKIIRKIRKFFKFSFLIRKIRNIFLSNNILASSTLSYGPQGWLYWKYIINYHVHFHFNCGRLTTIKVLCKVIIRTICNKFD